MPGELYRLKTATLAVCGKISSQLPLDIPNGRNRSGDRANITIDRQLVDVEWDGKKLIMFAVTYATVRDRDLGEDVGAVRDGTETLRRVGSPES